MCPCLIKVASALSLLHLGRCRCMHTPVCMLAPVCALLCPAANYVPVALQAKKIDRRMKACQGILFKSATCSEKQISSAQQQHSQVSCQLRNCGTVTVFASSPLHSQHKQHCNVYVTDSCYLISHMPQDETAAKGAAAIEPPTKRQKLDEM